MKRDAIILAIVLGLGLLLAHLAKGMVLVWPASPYSWVAGYRIYAATQSVSVHHLTNAPVKIDCGTNTSLEITNLLGSGDQYYVATAYTKDGQESLPSNEAIYHVPFLPPVLMTAYMEWAGTIPTTNFQTVGFVRLRIPQEVQAPNPNGTPDGGHAVMTNLDAQNILGFPGEADARLTLPLTPKNQP